MASDPSSMRFRAFKAAVALSNTGVTLLERHSYHDALSVIRDALFLIRAAFPGDEAIQPWLESAIHSALHKASQCLFRSHSTQEKGNQAATFNLGVLSDNQCRPTDVLLATEEVDGCAIRIDDSWYDEGVKSMDSEASIILFNYGTACRCLHSAGQPTSPQLLHEAFNILNMSYGVLNGRFVSVIKTADEIEVSRMLGISMLVLYNLMLLCIQLELPLQHQTYGNKLGRITSVAFSRLDNMPSWGYDHTAAAA